MSRRIPPTPDNIEVRKGDRTFELLVDGQHAGLITYRDNHGVRAMPHTEVDDAYQGKGLSKPLIKGALDQTRAEGLGVLPLCPAISTFMKRNEAYRDLVPAEQRAQFGLE